MTEKRNRTDIILFVIYCILLIRIILFKLAGSMADIEMMTGLRSLNLIPFRYDDEVSFQLHEVISNVAIFVPFGVYMKMLGAGNGGAVCAGFAASLILEASQYIFRLGATDITDLITNTAGTAMGVLMYLVVSKIFISKAKADGVIRIVASVGTILFVGLIWVLLLLN